MHTKVTAITPAEAPATAWERGLRADVDGWWWCEEDAGGDSGTAAVAGEVVTSPGISPVISEITQIEFPCFSESSSGM